MQKARTAALGAALVVVFAVFATAAYAVDDPWFSGSRGAGLGFASTGAHSITYIEGTANFNGFCVAKDTGLSGYGSSSRTPAGTPSCASSGGFANRTENGACCYHGWISNPLGFAITVNSSTHYSY
jgi:hypothetical protein